MLGIALLDVRAGEGFYPSEWIPRQPTGDLQPKCQSLFPKPTVVWLGEKGPRRAGLGMRLCQMTVGQLWVPEPQLKAYLSPQTGALPPPSVSSALKMGMLSPGSI